MNMYSLRRVLFLVLPVSGIICVIAWWAMHDRQHESSVSTDSWKGQVVLEWTPGIKGKEWKGSDAKVVWDIIERNSPLAALRAADPNDKEETERVLRDLAEFVSWSKHPESPGGPELRRNDQYSDVGSGFFHYWMALTADDCPQSERAQYCDTLLHLFRLRNSASDDQALNHFRTIYMPADWFVTCLKIKAPNYELESKFMELGWFRFLRTGILPDGWTMRDVGAGAKNPQGLSN